MIRSADPSIAISAYPERADVPQPAFDRLISQLKWRLHCMFRRCLPDSGRFAAAVHGYMESAGSEPLEPRLPDLRYRLRCDGFREDLLAECFGLYCAARARCGASQPGTEAFGAAQQLLTGSIVDLAGHMERIQALALAATALAMHGTPVHLISMSTARAQRIAEVLRSSFEALGISISCAAGAMPAADRVAAYRSAIVCGTHREIASAYLQDRLQMAGKSRLLMRALSGEAMRHDKERPPMLPGLCFALVEDADLVMLDDAYAPVTISMEADQAQERLLYEQTLELARACEPGTYFTFDEQGMRLTEAGSERLRLMVAPLGGIWAARQRREQLVTTALVALHAMECDMHYRVTQGRVIFPKPDPVNGGNADGPDPALVKLVELKEGCNLSTARDVLARISVPRFFRRYLNVAGVCADARGLEEDFWALYVMKTTRVGLQPMQTHCIQRMFLSVESKRAAVIEAVSKHSTGCSVVIAVRTPGEAQVLMGGLKQAGITAGLLRGLMDDSERATLSGLHCVGQVAVALFPAEARLEPTDEGRPPLHLIVAELHDAERHVVQMTRAFGAGSCEQLLSLDEEGIAARVGHIATGIASFYGASADELPPQQSRWLTRQAQRHAEQSRALMRRDLILRDDYMSDLLAFSGRRE